MTPWLYVIYGWPPRHLWSPQGPGPPLVIEYYNFLMQWTLDDVVCYLFKSYGVKKSHLWMDPWLYVIYIWPLRHLWSPQVPGPPVIEYYMISNI